MNYVLLKLLPRKKIKAFYFEIVHMLSSYIVHLKHRSPSMVLWLAARGQIAKGPKTSLAQHLPLELVVRSDMDTIQLNPAC